MSNSTPKARVEHVLHAIQAIESFITHKSLADFKEDLQLQSAVLYQFLIIGESIRNIDSDILGKYPYPWHIPKSFRNFIAHEYHKIKMERVYLAANDLNNLKNIINLILLNEF